MISDIANIFWRLRKCWLLIPGWFFFSSLDAQIPSQNLFARAQFIEYQRLRNQTWRQGNVQVRRIDKYVEFPVKCTMPDKGWQLWLKAEGFYADLHWEDAAKLYSAFIKVDSSFCDAYFRLAQCYVVRNDLVSAFRILKIVERKFNDN